MASDTLAQPARTGTIDDEALVPEYTLPELLTFADGSPVATAADWDLRRRPELLQLFRAHVYGTAPEVDYTTTSCTASHEVLSSELALGGLATRREIRLHLEGPSGATKEWVVLLYLPAAAADPSPASSASTSGEITPSIPTPASPSPSSWRRSRASPSPAAALRRSGLWRRS